jgi:hypothetical protein
MPSIRKGVDGKSDRVSVSASSHHSRTHRRTLSIASSQQEKKSDFDTLTHIAKSGKPQDDEWNAIVKFNTLLHYEEQKRAE